MTTRWHKKLVSYSFIAIISIILVSNMFITLWILTAIGKKLALKNKTNIYAPGRSEGNLRWGYPSK